jgi:hypothetical protein
MSMMPLAPKRKRTKRSRATATKTTLSHTLPVERRGAGQVEARHGQKRGCRV